MNSIQSNNSPKSLGYFMPAEWEHHQSCWLAWPYDANLWKEDLLDAQKEFTALCHALVDENLNILVAHKECLIDAQKALSGLSVRFHIMPYGDIWLRDTAPIFITHPTKGLASTTFNFNGWGGKYILDGDNAVAKNIATISDMPSFSFPFILEGGSIDVDGEGTCLTTKQCLLNPNRNPNYNQSQIENMLYNTLDISKVLWLNNGLINDHTDGHIDTIARFIAPGKVVCMQSKNPLDDPNHEVLEEIAHDLYTFSDAQQRKLEIIRIPSPGKILSSNGDILPASYLNFYIGNSTVVVPTYNSPFDDEAVSCIAELFPNRKTVGLSALATLTGGGAFHCITQQQPAGNLL